MVKSVEPTYVTPAGSPQANDTLEGFPLVKIFAERNCATNLIERLILENSATVVAPSALSQSAPLVARAQFYLLKLYRARWFEDRITDLGFRLAAPLSAWKHSATNFSSIRPFINVPILMVVRHPASWVAALHRRPYHAQDPIPTALADFVDMRWRTVGRDRLNRAVLTPIELYNAKLRAHLDFETRLKAAGMPVAIHRFEDIVTAQENFLEAIRPWLLRPATTPRTIREHTKPNAPNATAIGAYYAREAWRDAFADETKQLLNDSVDWPLVERFAYRPL